jgi:hypothetical protein
LAPFIHYCNRILKYGLQLVDIITEMSCAWLERLKAVWILYQMTKTTRARQSKLFLK